MPEAPTPPQDDDDLLDDVHDVVDDVLGTHLPPPEVEDPWERRLRRIDTVTAVLLGVAAVATTWATFQASQWSGSQSDRLADASSTRTESLRASSRAGETEQVDTAVWLQWLQATAQGDTRRARFLRERFPQRLAVAHTAWAQEPITGLDDLPPGTPFTRPEYVVTDRERADALAVTAERRLAESQDDATTSERFVTAALILALVLFFAGIATKFRAPRLQVALVTLGIVTCLVGLIRLLTLPQLF